MIAIRDTRRRRLWESQGQLQARPVGRRHDCGGWHGNAKANGNEPRPADGSQVTVDGSRGTDHERRATRYERRETPSAASLPHGLKPILHPFRWRRATSDAGRRLEAVGRRDHASRFTLFPHPARRATQAIGRKTYLVSHMAITVSLRVLLPSLPQLHYNGHRTVATWNPVETRTCP